MVSTDRTPDGNVSVAVVGSYNVGLTMLVPRFPVPGETVISSEFEEGGGGKGSNQAIAAVRLGAETVFVGQVGADRYGDDAYALWEREGVRTEYVSRDPESHTGVGFVLVEENGENEITVALGANDSFSPTEVRNAAAAIEAADVLLVQMEIPDDTIKTAVAIAQAAGVDVVLNPAPAREIPAEILRRVDYLTPNQSEARTLVGVDPTADRIDEDIARELLGLGVGTVVMTRGSDGAVFVAEDRLDRVGSPVVDVVDTTGAGDAFNGAFAVALSEGRSGLEATTFACTAGALAVTESEVIPGLPRRDAVEELGGAAT